MSTCMYYTGLDPRTMEQVYVPKNPHEKAMQRALIQYRDPKNRDLVREALERCGRRDLIGYGPKCLLRPAGGRPGERSGQKTDFRKNSSGNKAGGRTKQAETNVRNNVGAKKKTIRNVHKKK